MLDATTWRRLWRYRRALACITATAQGAEAVRNVGTHLFARHFKSSKIDNSIATIGGIEGPWELKFANRRQQSTMPAPSATPEEHLISTQQPDFL
jgi:hypothetical protein